MLVTLMKAKLHRATVTQADLEYEGSIAIDRDLLDASGVLPHEQVDVLNITTGGAPTMTIQERIRPAATLSRCSQRDAISSGRGWRTSTRCRTITTRRAATCTTRTTRRTTRT